MRAASSIADCLPPPALPTQAALPTSTPVARSPPPHTQQPATRRRGPYRCTRSGMNLCRCGRSTYTSDAVSLFPPTARPRARGHCVVADGWSISSQLLTTVGAGGGCVDPFRLCGGLLMLFRSIVSFSHNAAEGDGGKQERGTGAEGDAVGRMWCGHQGLFRRALKAGRQSDRAAEVQVDGVLFSSMPR